MNTHETYVSLETAKLLKQAGFDWNCFCYYEDKKLRGKNGAPFPTNMNAINLWNGEHYCSAPTLAVADRWLREVKNVHVEVMFSNTGLQYFVRYCDVTVHGLDDGHWHKIGSNDGYETYEEALEVGIKECLERLLMWKEEFGPNRV